MVKLKGLINMQFKIHRKNFEHKLDICKRIIEFERRIHNGFVTIYINNWFVQLVYWIDAIKYISKSALFEPKGGFEDETFYFSIDVFDLLKKMKKWKSSDWVEFNLEKRIDMRPCNDTDEIYDSISLSLRCGNFVYKKNLENGTNCHLDCEDTSDSDYDWLKRDRFTILQDKFQNLKDALKISKIANKLDKHCELNNEILLLFIKDRNYIQSYKIDKFQILSYSNLFSDAVEDTGTKEYRINTFLAEIILRWLEKSSKVGIKKYNGRIYLYNGEEHFIFDEVGKNFNFDISSLKYTFGECEREDKNILFRGLTNDIFPIFKDMVKADSDAVITLKKDKSNVKILGFDADSELFYETQIEGYSNVDRQIKLCARYIYNFLGLERTSVTQIFNKGKHEPVIFSNVQNKYRLLVMPIALEEEVTNDEQKERVEK
jgi:hypothetical protein